MGIYWVTGGVLLAYLVLAWFLGTWLHLHGSDLWILRGGLAFIGVVGAGIFLWFYRKSHAEEAGAAGEPADSSGNADIDLLVHEALLRLKSSTLGRGATLRNLPLVFLVGDSGSTKTSTILHSALDPELLAGHVYQDNNILPTRVLNIWYTRQAIFVDPAGDVLAQSSRWRRLVKLVQPGRVSSAMGKGQQAPRAAIVCFDCGNFLQPGASESTISAARKLAVRLHEISQLLSISFPVYVLFTKLDRVSFFSEFARGFGELEASEVLGATLPVRSTAAGVYAEEETKRLTKAFDELFYSLAEKRLDLLGRENEQAKLSGIYEFPREFRKLRTLLVQFMVDLARPSQLSVNPFLRGFYFSGVRPVIVGDIAPAAPQMQAAEPGFDGGATRILNVGGGQAAPPPVAQRASGSRKVPQWVFLSQLFNNVIVKDRVALAASSVSTRVNLLRRIGLILVGIVGIVCAIGFTVSFIGNHNLESEVRAALHDVQSVPQTGANQLASLADLQRLDRLRQELVTLASYEREGAPWSLRWGLYVGDRIYPDARKAYFERFHQLLFAETQQRILSALRALPDKPGPNDIHEKTYNELKAYLMTTSNNDKSTKEFLTPVLMEHWRANGDVDPDRAGLAKQQFDYYATELLVSNPFSTANDGATVERARNYLKQFPVADRIYTRLLAEASRKYPDLSFNEKFTDSVGVVLSNHVIRGAFTRNGFAFMQDAIRNPSNYMSAEEWVLGKVTASDFDQATLQQRLKDKFHDNFIGEWHTVLKESKVAPYHEHDLADADKKLEKLTSPSSPLLELLWFVSNNTNVDTQGASNPFLPVQALEPPGASDALPDQYILPSNKAYIDALAQLRADIEALVPNPNDQALVSKATASAGQAKVSITQVMGTRVDQTYHTENQIHQLLEEPITNAEAVLGRAGLAAVNGAGQAFCSQFATISGKYPFNPRATEDVSIEQLNSIFAPKAGALWTFYEAQLKKRFLPDSGASYVPASGGTEKMNPAFVHFFNDAAAFSKALYGTDSPTPKFSYTLKEMASNVEGLLLKVGNDTLSGTGQSKTFSWTGTPEEIQATTKSGEILGTFIGPWSIFKFVSDANSKVSGSVTNLEWIQQSNNRPIILPSGKQKSYNYQLQVSGYNPFRPEEWTGMRCVPLVAH